MGEILEILAATFYDFLKKKKHSFLITDRAREMKGESEEVAEIIAQMVKATFRPTAMPIETRPRRTSVFFYPPRISSISARVHGPISPTHQGRSASRSCCFRNPPAVNFVFFFLYPLVSFFVYNFPLTYVLGRYASVDRCLAQGK